MAMIKVCNKAKEQQIENTKWFAHYTNLQAACSILRSGSLRFKFGSMLSANDPREIKYWQFDTLRKNHTLGDNQQTRQRKLCHEQKITEKIKGEIASSSFAMDELPKNDKNNSLKVNWYTSYCRPRMWAQYADNHKGVCILFDKDALLQCMEKAARENHIINNIYYGAVDYFDGSSMPKFAVDEFPVNIDDITEENVDLIRRNIFSLEHIQAYLFRKHSDWEKEAEYRILLHRKADSKEKYTYIDCAEAIHEVILGVDCPDNDWRKELCDLCEEHEIAYRRIRWTNGHPGDDLTIKYNPFENDIE